MHGISQFQVTTEGVSGVIYDSLENPKTSLSDPDEWFVDAVGGGTTKAGVRVNSKTALGYPPFWRGVNIICNGVAKLAFHVYRTNDSGGGDRDKQHPAYKLLRRKPNPFMTAGVFKKLLQLHALIHGNGYAAIFRDGAGRPQELIPLSPTETYPVIANGQVWYVTTIGGQMIRIPHIDVLHIKGLSLDGLIGISVIDQMKDALGLGMAARRFGAHFFGQGSNSSGILMIPGHLKPDAIENTIKMWNEMTTGLSKSHKVGLLQDGVKYQPTTITPEQAQFLQTRQFEIREVANILGLPPHMLSDSSRSAYNTLEQENKSYLEHSLDPVLCVWEEEADEKLLSEEEKEDESHYTEFNRNALLRTDSKSRGEFYGKLSGIGAFTVNDVLRLESMPTIGKLGDKRYVPANWVEVKEEDPRRRDPAPPPRPAPPEPEEETEEESEETDDANAASLRKALGALLIDAADRFAKLEACEVRKVVAKGGDPAKGIDGIYGWFGDRLWDALDPIACAISSAGVGAYHTDMRTFVTDYIECSKVELKRAANAVAGGFAHEKKNAIDKVLNDWSNSNRLRTAAVAHFLNEEKHNEAA